MTTRTLTSPAALRSPLDGRIGGVAGLLIPVVCAAAVLSTAASGPNLRQGAFPWVAATGAVLAALATAALARRHATAWGQSRRVAAGTTVWALLGVAALFGAMGTEDLLNQMLGVPRFLSGSETVSAVGTLVASLLATAIVPVGLLVVGACTAHSRVLGRPARVAAAALGPVLVAGALLTGTTDTMWVPATWLMVFGGCWAVVGSALLREVER